MTMKGACKMSIPFKSPKPRHRYIIAKEKAAITRHFTRRAVPQPQAGRLLLGSWNIANLGAQRRTAGALELVTHILKRFELIAVQEVNEEFRTFAKIVRNMGAKYDYIMTDTAGNNERLAFIYDTTKVKPLNMFGELALRAYEFPKRTVKVRYRKDGRDMIDTFTDLRFVPFDRNPFIGTFQAGKINFTLVNTHLYFGKFQNSNTRKKRQRYARRVLEIYALSRWADRRVNRKATYDRDIILMGDMNVPNMDEDESTFEALTEFGFMSLDYVSKTGGSNLGNDKTYDQMAFAPGGIRKRIKNYDIFDFDKAIFAPLWKKLNAKHPPRKALSKFNAHVKHHVSDHRPLWVQLDIE